jgi:hypothetical protein
MRFIKFTLRILLEVGPLEKQQGQILLSRCQYLSLIPKLYDKIVTKFLESMFNFRAQISMSISLL